MLKLLSLSLAFCSQLTSASLPVKAGQIAGGLVEGFLGATDVQACIQKTATEIEGVGMAIKDLEQKTAAGVLNGLHLLAGAFNEIPAALTACKAVESDVKEIISALKQIHSPMSFAYHAGKDLIVNHNDIFHEITTAEAAYRAQKWKDFGVQIGKALHKLLIGVEGRFLEFEQKFGKIYSPEERQRRMVIFADNLKQMRDLARDDKGSAVYSHLSPFADISRQEFTQRNGYKAGLTQQDSPLELAPLLSTSELPVSFDWREKGAVTPVQDQGVCGSCWAFATVANIEGKPFVEGGSQKLRSLSVQQLLDCAKEVSPGGCDGGRPDQAFYDMVTNKIGLELASAYPYINNNHSFPRVQQCQAKAAAEKVFIRGSLKFKPDEDGIARALIEYGPLAIGINSYPTQFYHGGVLNPRTCNEKDLNHAVAIVGFGVDSGLKYWIMKNSLGSHWGEEGYFRIIRGVGMCGLNLEVLSAINVGSSSVETAVIV